MEIKNEPLLVRLTVDHMRAQIVQHLDEKHIDLKKMIDECFTSENVTKIIKDKIQSESSSLITMEISRFLSSMVWEAMYKDEEIKKEVQKMVCNSSGLLSEAIMRQFRSK